jgi:hypothetical protein
MDNGNRDRQRWIGGHGTGTISDLGVGTASITNSAVSAPLLPRHRSVKLHRNSRRSSLLSSNGASPQPDEPCLGQLLLPEQAHAGTRGQSDRPPPPATPRYVTSTRSAYMQVRCAVVALWSEHHRRYAHQIRPASTKLDSILPTSSDLAWLVVATLDRGNISGAETRHASTSG